MTRILAICVVGIILVDPVEAQLPVSPFPTLPPFPTIPKIRTGTAQPPLKPTFSPYLHLLRRDGGIGFQYYRGVLPEREFRDEQLRLDRSLRNFGRQIEDIDRPPARNLGGNLGTTGHPTAFQSYGGLSGNRSAGGVRPAQRR